LNYKKEQQTAEAEHLFSSQEVEEEAKKKFVFLTLQVSFPICRGTTGS
jgi:hypothetical protein